MTTEGPFRLETGGFSEVIARILTFFGLCFSVSEVDKEITSLFDTKITTYKKILFFGIDIRVQNTVATGSEKVTLKLLKKATRGFKVM